MSAPQAWMLRGNCACSSAICLYEQRNNAECSLKPTTPLSTCAVLICGQRHFAGPMAFGLIISSLLFGVIVVLSIQFFNTSSRRQEKASIWWPTLLALILTVAATGVEMYGQFQYFVVNAPTHVWDVGMIPFIPPLHVSLAIGMLATAISQIYFGSRAYSFVSRYEERFGRHAVYLQWLAGFCVSLLVAASEFRLVSSLSGCGLLQSTRPEYRNLLLDCAGLALMIISGYVDYGKMSRTGIDAFMYSGGMPPERVLNAQHALYGLWICGSAAIDVIYTSVLCARLAIDKRESAFAATSLTLSRILSYTLTTSAVTTTCALLAMFLYYCYSIGTVHLFFMTILPKLYIICLFFTLVSRKNVANTLNGSRSTTSGFKLGTFSSSGLNSAGLYSAGLRSGGATHVGLPSATFTQTTSQVSEKQEY